MLTDEGLASVRLIGAALLMVFSAGSSSAQISKPDSASVVGTVAQKLTYGQPYIFQVRLRPTPQGYDRGSVIAEFQCVEKPNDVQ
jgi:hypothetical protein